MHPDMMVPIVYIGEKETDFPHVLGIRFSFCRNIPRLVELRFANLLLNRGSYINATINWVKKFEDPKFHVKRVLIVRSLHSLGDMLYASVTPKAFKRRFPKAIVDIAVPRASFPIWQWNPFIDNLIASDEIEAKKLKGTEYDVWFDITRPCVQYEMSNMPSHKSRIDIYMEACGVQLPMDEKRPIYTVLPEEREWAKKITGGRCFLGIQLRANSSDRNWIPGNQHNQENNIAIIKKWLKYNDKIDVMVLDQHEEFMAKIPDDKRIFKCAGNDTRRAMALLERCIMTMTLNSGLLVASGALGIPQVSLFGNINPDCRTTYLPNVEAIYKPESCVRGIAPCWGTCGNPTCMRSITVEEVFAALKRNFEKNGENRKLLLDRILEGDEHDDKKTLCE